uniref:Uncharacterized protein n=1 Tax=Arundo donax TaxID=35708 RepID=A0A0A8Y5Q1_ARUDO
MEDPLTSFNRRCDSVVVEHVSLEQVQILQGLVQPLQMDVLWIT